MILAVAATEFEMEPFLRKGGEEFAGVLTCGVGILESCMTLTRYLEKHRGDVSTVFNFGVGGAYQSASGTRPKLLDICLAQKEIFGELGVCYPRRIDELGDELRLKKTFALDDVLMQKVLRAAKAGDISVFQGNFVTVCSVSGTTDRGEILRRKYDGLCENMEGVAIARVCEEFSLPFVEMRCISNYVEDRDLARWRLREACEKAGKTAAFMIRYLG